MGLIAVRLTDDLEQRVREAGSISDVVRLALVEYLSPKKGKPPAKTALAQEVDFELAEWIMKGVRRIKPDMKIPNMVTWAEDCRKMRVLDNRTPRQIAEVFKWANNDHFWQTNVLSPAKLRKQFDQLEIKSKQVTRNDRQAIDHNDTSWIESGDSGSDKQAIQPHAWDQAWLAGSVSDDH